VIVLDNSTNKLSLLKKESIILLAIIIISVLVTKIIFYKESIFIVTRTVVSFFWLFIIPGFIIMYYWSDRLDFLERLFVGTALNTAFVGVMSYYLGIIGINISTHGIILPVAVIIIGLVITFSSRAKTLPDTAEQG